MELDERVLKRKAAIQKIEDDLLEEECKKKILNNKMLIFGNKTSCKVKHLSNLQLLSKTLL
jgi:hypothetical protein